MSHLSTLFFALFVNKSSLRFSLAVVLGISFSIGIILATIGIMDGFTKIVENNLVKSSGDISISSRDGFFKYDEIFKDKVINSGGKSSTPIIQSEAFVVREGMSRGVALRGVESKTFHDVSGLDLKNLVNKDDIIVGKELAKAMNITKGELITVMFAKGNSSFSSMPLLKSMKVVGFVDHGIYQKNLRIAYVKLNLLSDVLKTDNFVNLVLLDIHKNEEESLYNQVEDTIFDMEEYLGRNYRLRPFWYEFSGLLEAVKIEKVSISLILQIIVCISIFNVLAFIIYLNEKRSKDIFLIQALGLKKKQLIFVWSLLLFSFWALSCLLSLIWIKIFQYALWNWNIFKLPGHIYQLERLVLNISPYDYTVVFGGTLIWFVLITFFGLWRIGQQSILLGLRKEFA